MTSLPLTNDAVKYIAGPGEISVCDRPCAPSAVFSAVKQGGGVELRKFAKREEVGVRKYANYWQRRGA